MPEGTIIDTTHGYAQPKTAPSGDSSADAMPEQLDPFFDRLPSPITQTLTGEQKQAISKVLPGRTNRKPPVNIRLSMPMLRWRFYFTVMAGRERRSPTRLMIERSQHPVRTASNIMFILGGAMVLYMLTLGGFLFYASIVNV